MQEPYWQTADAIARELVKRDCDPSEAQKAFVYLRTHRDGDRFFRLLEALVRHGRFLVRSGRTLDYYKTILEVCQRYLSNHRADPEAMSQILGWAIRLMRYYMSQQIRPESPGSRARPRGRR